MLNISDTDRLSIDKQQKPFSGANNDLLRAGIEKFASTGPTLQIHWSYTAANCVAKSCSAAVLQVRETAEIYVIVKVLTVALHSPA